MVENENVVEENTVEEVEETVTESVDYTGIALDVFNIACAAREVADCIQNLDNGAVKGKAEFNKAAVKVRADLRPLFDMVKKARADILTWKADKVAEIPGARKTKTKEQLMEEAQALIDRAQTMN